MILLENHIKDNGFVDKTKSCTCSYCKGEYRLHYGLNIPKNWRGWNSWWVVKYGDGKYIRWTNSWLKILREKENEIKEEFYNLTK